MPPGPSRSSIRQPATTVPMRGSRLTARVYTPGRIPPSASGRSYLSAMAETDLELVRRIGGRDPVAFETLYQRYAPACYGVALRVLRQAFLAQEVVHDSFLAVWNAPDAYDGTRGPFRSFLLSLVHHRAVDAVRREERLRDRERRANPEALVVEDVVEAVVEEADLSDRRRAVREAVRALAPEQREAVELMYFR